MFDQKAFLLGLFSGELIFGSGGRYYCKEFYVLKWDRLDNKKQPTTKTA